MTTVFEAIKSITDTFVDDDPKTPLHVGEVMSCWTYLAMINEAARALEIALNTTTDQELRDSLIDSKEQCAAQSKIMTDFLTLEGISLPPTSEAKPQSDPSNIPLGVKMTDDEIANGVSIKTVTAIIHCATSAAQSVRNDVGIMFAQFQVEKMKYGATLKTLMRKRGWIKVPPYFTPPGLPKS